MSADIRMFKPIYAMRSARERFALSAFLFRSMLTPRLRADACRAAADYDIFSTDASVYAAASCSPAAVFRLLLSLMDASDFDAAIAATPRRFR